MPYSPRMQWNILVWFGALCLSGNLFASSASGSRGVVATVHPIATDAALEVMKHGGNAVDGAVAAALTLGVVDGYNSGIGGGCFLLIRLANGTMIAIDGRETAPGAASRDMFLRNGKAVPQLSETGALASGVPGTLAACDFALRRYGKLALKDHLLKAAEIAESGFKIDRSYAQRLRASAADLKRFEASRAIFLHKDNSPLKAGELLKQADLAGTYRAIATEGIDWFYRGPFAVRAEKWMEESGGLLNRNDFAAYQAKVREPVTNSYRGYEIVAFPPPSSGGVHVAQILNILENFDIAKLGVNSAAFVHLATEAMKLAFADRAYWLGDPDFAKVPRGLISKKYAAQLASRIRLDRATEIASHGTPDSAGTDVFGKHTTHFCTADAAGNWVACTATINTPFGSKVVIPGTGVVMNNEMDDFSSQPGVANYFGLIGAGANAIAPGKRPLSSMSPTIVLKNGKPILSVGAAGGPTIISQTVLAIIYTIDFKLPVDTALGHPRFHHQWNPNELRIERRFGNAVLKELERLGHHVAPVDSLGAAQAMAGSADARNLTAVSDPRLEGKAAGF